MTDVSNIRRVASEILKCGVNRVWIEESSLPEVSLALTREDCRKLIHDGTIRKKQSIGISRGRARIQDKQRKKNQKNGPGRHKGGRFARMGHGNFRKRLWINRIRPQRRLLQHLRDTKQLSPADYRKFYLRSKGGQFKSVSYLRNQLQEGGFLKGQAAP